MRQAAAFLKDKTALFKEEPDTQANRLGAEITLLLLLLLLIATLPQPTHTPLLHRTHAHAHTLALSSPPCRQPAGKGLRQNALTKENYSVNSS